MAIQVSPNLLFLSSLTCCLPLLCTRIIIRLSLPPFPLADIGGSCNCQAEARAHLKKYHGRQPRVGRKLSAVRTSCQQPSSSLYNFLALKKKKKITYLNIILFYQLFEVVSKNTHATQEIVGSQENWSTGTMKLSQAHGEVLLPLRFTTRAAMNLIHAPSCPK